MLSQRVFRFTDYPTRTPFKLCIVYAGRAVVALAADPALMKKSGRVFSTWGLSEVTISRLVGSDLRAWL